MPGAFGENDVYAFGEVRVRASRSDAGHGHARYRLERPGCATVAALRLVKPLHTGDAMVAEMRFARYCPQIRVSRREPEAGRAGGTRRV
jgi:hypothetical protein